MQTNHNSESQFPPGLNDYLEIPDAKDKVLSQENILFYKTTDTLKGS